MIDQVFDFVRDNYAGLVLVASATGCFINGIYHRRQEKIAERLAEVPFSAMNPEQKAELQQLYRRHGLNAAADLVSMLSSYQTAEH